MLVVCVTADSVVVAGDLRDQIEPLFAKYCSDCHAGGADEGGLDLDVLGDDLSDAETFARWERLFDRVMFGEMPPKDSSPVATADLDLFRRLIDGQLQAAHRNAKGTVYRRLNRREYQNTMNDLFGTNLDLQGLLPEDGRTGEFDNVGASLNVSMVQLQRYLEAADLVMDTAIAKTVAKPAAKVKLANYADTREGEKHIGTAWKQLDDGSVVFFRDLSYPTGMLRTADVQTAGRYKIRVTGYAYQSDKPITFAIGATTFQRGAERPTFAYREMNPGGPMTVEVEAWIEERYMIELTPWGISDPDYLIKKHGLDAYQGPGLAISQVELIGPLVDEFPSRGHRLMFTGLGRNEIPPRNPELKDKPWYVPQFTLRDDADDLVPDRLREIATTVFRRPANQESVDRYVQLYQDQRADGLPAEPSLKTAVAAILCSPDFLYLQEPAGRLDDYALASRLSYFLTRTAPDAELLAAAASGDLTTDRDVLLKHTRRLLADPKHQRFVIDFTDAWLNLREIDFTSPDQSLFPEYDSFLQHSILQESRQFFSTLIAQNLSVVNLVKSDFAMLNNRLGLHYEIDGVDGPQVRSVRLVDDSVRGGVLTQASVLKVSANGTNTSPVVRGVWVMERILGVHPPPPPPGIPGVEPDVRGASTLRELLDKHRNLDQCMACHHLIDPPGFALESFNPVGGWRDRFRRLGEGEKVDKVIDGRKVRYRLGPPVDATGQLVGGEKFTGFLQFRDLLARDEDRLTRAFATKLLTFASGREMGFSDRDAIEEIVAQSKRNGHGVRGLIETIVASELFHYK
ncbi:DUF1592 domain-containing protein [Rubripirellula reticaptiva]|uniref:Planctomycete cytochrome C n=1 Tax=Rubripirellula reticaptiva TaxID=2528013 RepID=A0A5C6EJH5_9BACT|nr:DUF1592 domain-containing protein [Rubripirellula reticaptiva]TWU49843.1 hypothetical protein Poly59_44680 [Rubripirellula reticaptiva]